MRSGAGWDLLAAAALALPLTPVALGPRVLDARRRATIASGTLLATVAVWTVLLAVGAAPALGGWSPDGVAMAGAAGAALLAACGSGVVPPAAVSLVAFAAGAWDAPRDLSSGVAVALVVVGAAGAAALCWRDPNPGIVAGLFVALRGATALGSEPPAVAGVAVAFAAAAVALLGGRGVIRLVPATVASILAAAVALAPVAEVRPWAALVAAGAVFAATDAGPWVLLALVPGVAVVATAAADVPTASGAVAHAIWAIAAGVAVLAVAAARLRPPPMARPAPAWTPDSIAVAVLTAWLVVAPGSWRWAVADPSPLAAWDRAAAIAVAAGGVVALAGAARQARDRVRQVAAG